MSVDGSPAAAIDITLGATNIASTTPNFEAAAYVLHPSYGSDPGGGFDVALIRMDKAADLEQLRLLRPGDAAKWEGGVTATVIGWGRTDDEQPGSSQLLEAQVPMYADAGCAADFQAAGAPAGFFVPATMVCAGGKNGRDACQGDSGGPLLVPDGARFALGGVVSFGAVVKDASGRDDGCANGLPGVYARVGADPLNGWVRSLIPQVEIDAAPAEPEPGQQVKLTAAGTPNHYERYEWDLDDDGAFDDATGSTAGVTVPRGVTTVGVRAIKGTGDQRDQETRRIDLEARFRSAVAFAAPAVTVAEGDPVTVTLAKTGAGAGTLVAEPTAGTADLSIDFNAVNAPLTFAAEQATQTITIPTTEDKDVEPDETFTIDLRQHTGELVPGAPSQLTVTIDDDDVKPRITGLTKSAKRRAGRVTLKYRIATPSSVTLGITDARGKVVLASLRRRHTKPGTYTAKLKLTKAATRLLRRKRVVTGRAVYAIFDGDDLLDSRILKFKLRR